MEPEGSLPCSKNPTTSSYPEPDESSLHLSIVLLSSHRCLGLPSGLFFSGFPTEIMCDFLISFWYRNSGIKI
jgi:hypothetical protein